MRTIVTAVTAILLAQSSTPLATTTTPTLESMLTTPSMNVFRRFSVDRAREAAFYGDALGLPALSTFGMPGRVFTPARRKSS